MARRGRMNDTTSTSPEYPHRAGSAAGPGGDGSALPADADDGPAAAPQTEAVGEPDGLLSDDETPQADGPGGSVAGGEDPAPAAGDAPADATATAEDERRARIAELRAELEAATEARRAIGDPDAELTRLSAELSAARAERDRTAVECERKVDRLLSAVRTETERRQAARLAAQRAEKRIAEAERALAAALDGGG